MTKCKCIHSPTLGPCEFDWRVTGCEDVTRGALWRSKTKNWEHRSSYRSPAAQIVTDDGGVNTLNQLGRNYKTQKLIKISFACFKIKKTAPQTCYACQQRPNQRDQGCFDSASSKLSSAHAHRFMLNGRFKGLRFHPSYSSSVFTVTEGQRGVPHLCSVPLRRSKEKPGREKTCRLLSGSILTFPLCTFGAKWSHSLEEGLHDRWDDEPGVGCGDVWPERLKWACFGAVFPQICAAALWVCRAKRHWEICPKTMMFFEMTRKKQGISKCHDLLLSRDRAVWVFFSTFPWKWKGSRACAPLLRTTLWLWGGTSGRPLPVPPPLMMSSHCL